MTIAVVAIQVIVQINIGVKIENVLLKIREYPESSYYMENESTLNREYGAFNKIRDNSPKYVFSLDKKDTSRNGITHINIIDFLMNKVDLMFS